MSIVNKINSRKFYLLASLVVQTVKNLPAMQETPVRLMGWEHPLDNG